MIFVRVVRLPVERYGEHTQRISGLYIYRALFQFWLGMNKSGLVYECQLDDDKKSFVSPGRNGSFAHGLNCASQNRDPYINRISSQTSPDQTLSLAFS